MSAQPRESRPSPQSSRLASRGCTTKKKNRPLTTAAMAMAAGAGILLRYGASLLPVGPGGPCDPALGTGVGAGLPGAVAVEDGAVMRWLNGLWSMAASCVADGVADYPILVPRRRVPKGASTPFPATGSAQPDMGTSGAPDYSAAGTGSGGGGPA